MRIMDWSSDVCSADLITASYFEAVHVIGIDAGTFWQVLRDAVDYCHDFIVAFQKAAVFGGTAALVACYVGYHAEPTIEGTSVATTCAVVNGSLLVLMFNFVSSALLFRCADSSLVGFRLARPAQGGLAGP